jgi:hypothetical protein
MERGTHLPIDLASRRGDGLDVMLLWDKQSGRLWVDVLHMHTGRTFEVEAKPDNALDVFYHPFAYGTAARALAAAA